MRRTVIALACLGLVLAGCGKDETPSATGSPGTQDCNPKVTGEAGKKPKITIPDCPPPLPALEKTDLIVGTGKEAKGLGTMTFHYVGSSWTLKGEFDASWDNNAPLTYELAGLIKGWQEGIPGMKEGGRRMLIIPPNLAYGPQAPSPKIAANDTLVFVIDLIKA